MQKRGASWAKGLVLVGLTLGAGCKKANADVPLSKRAGDGTTANIPVPPENGPKLFTLAPGVRVFEKPSINAAEVGELLVGASVSRSDQPVGHDGCPGGYYAVRPRGFICHDEKTSLDPGSAVREPDLAHALPYRYGRANASTPLYARVPTPDEQNGAEPNLGKHLTKASAQAAEKLGAGANDVPVDERGAPTGPATVDKNAQGLDSSGARTRDSYFAFNEEPAPAGATSGDAVSTVLRKGSTVAITATFMAPGPSGSRRFGVLPDGRFFPIDRLDPVLGTTWHGVDLTKDVSLPIAFVIHHEVCPYKIANAKATRLEDDEVERRSVVQLSNKYRELEGVRYEEANDGTFYRAKDIVKVVKRTKFPDFVAGDTKWVDVSLALQTMTLYEGKKAIYSTLVSSGETQIGDPATSPATQQGTFKISRKALYAAVDSKEGKDAFDLMAAPYSLEFAPGFTLRGAYWSDAFGEARAYHDINVAPVDERRLFNWVGGDVPYGWVWAAGGDDVTVVVRK